MRKYLWIVLAVLFVWSGALFGDRKKEGERKAEITRSRSRSESVRNMRRPPMMKREKEDSYHERHGGGIWNQHRAFMPPPPVIVRGRSCDCDKDRDSHHEHGKKGFCVVFLLMILIMHILLSVWVYKDTKQRNASGLWIIITLLSGFLGAFLYALVRIGDVKK